MNQDPKSALKKSPFNTLDQILGFIESYSNSNKSVRLLARGTTDNLGQSVDRLMRFNVCPYIHFRSSLDEDNNIMDEQMKEAMTVGHAPVIDPRVTGVVSRLEDRLQAWYEMLNNIEEEYEIEALSEMLKDMKVSLQDLMRTHNVPLNSMKQSSTGSERMDSLRNMVLLLCGIISTDDLLHRSKDFTLWLIPEELRGSRWYGDYVKIQKRDDLLSRHEKDGNGLKVFANRPEYAVREVYPKLQIDHFMVDEVKVPDMWVTGIVKYKGSRLMELRSGLRVAYMTLPNARVRMDHLKLPGDRPWPGAISKWLSRQRLLEGDFDDIIDGYMESTWIGACIRSLCIKVAKMSVGGDLIQIQERVAQAPERNIRAMPISDDQMLLEFAMSFEPMSEAEMIADNMNAFSDAFVDMAEGLKYEDLGLEAFSLESSFTSLELNRTIRDLVGIITGLQKVSARSLQGSEAGKFLSWFNLVRSSV